MRNQRIIVIKFDNHQGGGTFVVARTVINMLKKKFPDNPIAVCYIDENVFYIEEDGVKKPIKNFWKIPPFIQPFAQCFFLRKFIREDDLLLAFQGTTLLLPKKNKRICYVHHSNAYRYYDDAKWKKFPYNVTNIIFAIFIFILESFQHPDELMLNSTYTMKRCFHLHSKKKKFVLYPPVPLSSEEISVTKSEQPIVSLGRIHPEKNHSVQLKIAGMFPKLKFNIIGFCPPSEYSKWFVKEVKLYANINTNYNLSDPEIENEFRKSKYFLHTMEGEHFGIAIAQAAMQGCILIINSKGGSKEIAPEVSLLYKNINELKDILNKISEGSINIYPDENRILSIRKKFSEETFSENLYDLVKNYLD